jgi:hypothetical protein
MTKQITQTKTINLFFVVGGLPMIERIRNAKGGVISIDERNQIIPLLFLRFAYIATHTAAGPTKRIQKKISTAEFPSYSFMGLTFFPFK